MKGTNFRKYGVSLKAEKTRTLFSNTGEYVYFSLQQKWKYLLDKN